MRQRENFGGAGSLKRTRLKGLQGKYSEIRIKTVRFPSAPRWNARNPPAWRQNGLNPKQGNAMVRIWEPWASHRSRRCRKSVDVSRDQSEVCRGMEAKTLEDELQEWEKLARAGDFSRLPKPFLWRESAVLAHFLDGYREAGGLNELSRFAITKAEEFRSTGQWQGSALELWLCLFFEHRAARHTGSEPGHGDELCGALQDALNKLTRREGRLLAKRFTKP